jgi:hypothetical protein
VATTRLDVNARKLSAVPPVLMVLTSFSLISDFFKNAWKK